MWVGGGYEVKCRCVSMGRKARGAVLQAVHLSFGGQSVSLASNSPVVYRLADQKAITVSPAPSLHSQHFPGITSVHHHTWFCTCALGIEHVSSGLCGRSSLTEPSPEP